MKLTLLIAGSVLTLFSFLPLISTPLWWIRVLDFPRVHVALLLTITTVAYVVCYGLGNTREIILIALWGLAILNEARYIFPFTPIAPIEALQTEQKQPRNSFNIMIANVRMTNTKYQKFLELVLETDPDMVVINEPNEAWHNHMRQELEDKYKYSIKKPLENTYGMMLYSKLKLHNSEIRYLVEDSIPSFYTVVELAGGAKFDFFTVHPQPPRLLKNTETREAELLIVAKQAKATSYPSIVAGDLNDVAWSNTTRLFKNISGMLDPRVGRGFYNTYNAFIPLFRYPLDHVFYDPTFRLLDIKRLKKFGSDHFPIMITLNYEPQDEEKQEHPVAAPEEHEEANEMIQEGLKKGEELNGERKGEEVK
ncbi:endonuclease/exonuclease/phosphatase [Pontibacter qinzhouensis]|uniref:Endonuclease/exonuclease/phosphatase n=1 Tax=Pontibacter qinzhouensis TaxID=2603253 RepID=A0A5C8IZT1_9BACT|nr:endonuclease/exonuclease/phosphatase family protein [Pontibacter qinzhouensis]TXK28262.1 endonuclease/exonuclease/phosphatase [Pontibacter qinzhouensis]